MQPPSISVLIRTFNSEKTLDEVLTRLNPAERDEFIIVDSGSTDGTLAIAEKHQARIVEVPPPFNYSRSINAGFEVAQGDFVIVLSSHCLPLSHGLLSRMREVAAKSAADIAVCYGRISLFDPGTIAPKVTTADLNDWKSRKFRPGGNGFAMYPTRFWHIHKFDENLKTAEDLDWLARVLAAGLRAASVADAVVLYRNQGSMRYMFRKGWNETLLARSIEGFTQKPTSIPKALRSFLTNCLHLTKFLLRGGLGPREYVKNVSHGLGSAMASTTRG